MAKEEQTGAGRKQAKSRGAAQDDAAPTQAPGADTPDPADEESSGGSTYLVPGLERGLRILAEFSAREPVLGAPAFRAPPPSVCCRHSKRWAFSNA
jgi:hypothetical protein